MLQVDGVSVTSRVVVNGTRFGACYNNRTFEANGYPAYLTSREENGLAVRGDEGLLVVEYTGVRWRTSYASLCRRKTGTFPSPVHSCSDSGSAMICYG